MFGKSMEDVNMEKLQEKLDYARKVNEDLKDLIKTKDDTIRELNWKNSIMAKEFELKEQSAINDLRTKMQESLIKSDLLRTEALAKLEVYEKCDTKADANTIKEMIGKLIERIGMQKSDINIVK